MINKKIIVPTLVAIATMLLLVVGATYAYILVQSNDNFDNLLVTSKIDEVGTVTINKTAELNLNLVYAQVSKPDQDTIYYATTSGPTTEEQSPIIATATVTGPGVYNCSYNLFVTAQGDIFNNSVNKGTGFLQLTVNGGINGNTPDVHDFNTSWSDKNVTGTLTDISANSPKNITAQLFFKNSSTVDQYALSGTNGTVTFSITSFECTATS